ncbi:MAG: hypothetical protein B6244_12910 [Candidatus Cloacimonetes bacterium 4572_55]|nr:MAG: hypothetical protein B6244_12910 [Candidatus Cloacimonetes bacterium 4572_55]
MSFKKVSILTGFLPKFPEKNDSKSKKILFSKTNPDERIIRRLKKPPVKASFTPIWITFCVYVILQTFLFWFFYFRG